MASYSYTSDAASGLIYGPTTVAAGGFPSRVYLSFDDYNTWQAAADALTAAYLAAQAAAAAMGASQAAAAAAAAQAYQAGLAAQIAVVANSPGGSPTPALPGGAIAPPALPSHSPTPATPAVRPRLTPHSITGAGATPQLLGDDYCSLYPADPLCQEWGSGGPINIGFPGGTNTVTTIIEPGLSATDITSAIQGGLSALWSVAVSAIDVVLGNAIHDIQSAITKLGNALLGAWQILGRLAGFILNFLHHLLEDVIRALHAAIVDVVRVVKSIVTGGLVPMLKALQALRQKIIDLYLRFVRPLLIIIQDIRRVLAILRIFHIKFAQKLDAELAGFEARLTAPIFFLLKYTNAVANWINLIVTAGYLLQKPIFLASLKAYVGASTNLIINSMNPSVDPAAVAASNAQWAVPPPAKSAADFTTYLQTRSGPFAVPIAQAGDTLDQILQRGF